MRCEEVTRELSTPTGRLDPASVAGHLAGCSRCAAWAERSERLDRLWDATRPAEPSAFEFDRLWAGVVSSVEAGVEPEFGIEPEVGEGRPVVAGPGRGFRWGGMVGVFAAAAAVLIAGILTLRPKPIEHSGPGLDPGTTPVEVAFAGELIEIPDGGISVVSMDADKVEVLELPGMATMPASSDPVLVPMDMEPSGMDPTPLSVASSMMFNYFESPESVW